MVIKLWKIVAMGPSHPYESQCLISMHLMFIYFNFKHVMKYNFEVKDVWCPIS